MPAGRSCSFPFRNTIGRRSSRDWRLGTNAWSFGIPTCRVSTRSSLICPDTKVMITLRAHALILRSLMNLPCLSLRLEPKLEILARASGQEKFVLDLNGSPETLLDAILEAHSTSMHVEATCQTARQRLAGEAAALVDWIRRHS
jgi:polysaccharide pyruvyl transferase WcaK-like protein